MTASCGTIAVRTAPSSPPNESGTAVRGRPRGGPESPSRGCHASGDLFRSPSTAGRALAGVEDLNGPPSTGDIFHGASERSPIQFQLSLPAAATACESSRGFLGNSCPNRRQRRKLVGDASQPDDSSTWRLRCLGMTVALSLVEPANGLQFEDRAHPVVASVVAAWSP